jgi:hypothetical protein
MGPFPRLAAVALVASGPGCGGPKWTPPPPESSLEGLASGTPVVLTPEDDLLSSVSEDGRFLAVVSEINGNLDVWVRDFADDAFYPVTRAPADDFDPDIAGDRLVFASRRSDAKGDILLGGLKPGGGAELLTGTESADRQPVFSPDGRRVYFTSAPGLGAERIESVELRGRSRRIVSPGPGFDPEPAPDGVHLVYTAPASSERPAPHLALLRLTDGATVTLTRGRGPEGFARFAPAAPGEPLRLVYVRFPDDDDGDGRLTGADRASLWELRFDDLAAVFTSNERPRPFPLTDGSDEELFPSPGPYFLYFTRGSVQQDILRMRPGGLYPRYADPDAYFALARSIDDPRTRWFAYRCVLARTPLASPLAARARLAIGDLHVRRGRPDLARAALDPLASRSDDSPLVGLARIEVLALGDGDPQADRSALEALRIRHAGQPAVQARAALESARITARAGDTEGALEALTRVEGRWQRDRPVAARAALERLLLLARTSDPDALGAAYAQVARRYADLPWVTELVAERIVACMGSTPFGPRPRRGCRRSRGSWSATARLGSSRRSGSARPSFAASSASSMRPRGSCGARARAARRRFWPGPNR